MLQLHGHRGCRGLMPENTLEAFHLALELGVDTLEMDVCLSKDGEVVVSHEPWFSHEYCTQPNGEPIAEAEEKNFNLFQLEYAAIKTFDCGLKDHPRFPVQHKTAAHKPLLRDVLRMAEAYAHHRIRYNIEIKYTAEGLDLFHPDVATFSNAVMAVLQKEKITGRTMVQCFDTDVLEFLHQHYPSQTLSFLVEEPGSVRDHLKKLSFTPEVYSPDYTFVTPAELQYARQEGLLVIPWTVNKDEDMEQLIAMGVDGIITDYPDRLIRVKEKWSVDSGQ